MTQIPPDDHYLTMQQAFRWQVPSRFNMAVACCHRWAQTAAAARRVAVIEHQAGADPITYSFADLFDQANRLSSALAGLGVGAGDRVAIVMPQRFETAVAYIAVLQLGAVAVPLSQLFGPDALQFRLHDAGVSLAICDQQSLANLQAARADCPDLKTVIGLGQGSYDHAWDDLLAAASSSFDPVDTSVNDPAVLIYTSGTTGSPKGALIAHRALIGNLPGFVCSHNGLGFDLARRGLGDVCAHAPSGDADSADDESQAVFWSPADWAWTGGLMDALLPALYFGRPIVAFSGRFNARVAFDVLTRHGVTHSFLFPTALKAMMKEVPVPGEHHTLQLQGLMSAGEAVGDAVFAWCREHLGVVVNEMFGQTEVNYIVGNCAMNVAEAWAQTAAAGPALDRKVVGWPARPGSMGRGYPGHRVVVIDDDGKECAAGVAGEVAVHRCDLHGDPNPIFFLGYWNNEEATREKFSGDWWRTGDVAHRDEDGYLWYEGRADDVFNAAGYRIGPGEIENCLVKHPAVGNCAVVPKPDTERGALVKAYVVLSQDYAGRRDAHDDVPAFELEVTAALQSHVRGLLAPYEYPKEIEFIDELPMTTTGKVRRRVLRLQEEARARAAASGA